MTADRPGHPVFQRLLADLGDRGRQASGDHLSDADLGELATGRSAQGAGKRTRPHLDSCLACLSRFTELQAALTTPPSSEGMPHVVSTPPEFSALRETVRGAVEEARRATATLSALMPGVSVEQPNRRPPAGQVLEVESPVYHQLAAPSSHRGGPPTQRATDELLAALDKLAADTSQRLKNIWALRALVKKLRRVRRQIRKSDLPTYRKAELRAELGDAEALLLASLQTLRPTRPPTPPRRSSR